MQNERQIENLLHENVLQYSILKPPTEYLGKIKRHAILIIEKLPNPVNRIA